MPDYTNSLFEVVSEGIQAGIIIVDRELQITYCNTWFERFTGLAAEKLVGSPIKERFNSTQSAFLTSVYSEVLEKGTSFVLSPWLHPDIFQHDSGSPVYIFTRLLPVIDTEGRVQGVITTISDLTEINQFELKLSERNHRLTMISELTNLLNKPMETGSLVEESLMLVTRMTKFNGGVIYLLNEPDGSFQLIAANGILEHIPPDLLEMPDSSEALKSILHQKTHEIEKSGTDAWPFQGQAIAGIGKNIVFVPLTAEGKPLGVMLLVSTYTRQIDEGELKLLENFGQQIGIAIQNTTYLNDLISLNKGKDKMFSVISHDLKSPFNTILGFADLLLNDYHSLSDAERINMIRMIKGSSQQAFRLTDELLQWAGLNSGKLVMTKTVFGISELAENALIMVLPAAEQKTISIGVQFEQNYKLYADFQSIRTVLFNLMMNAVKFTRPGGRISVNARPDEKFLIVNVSDNGIGIPDEIKRKLFMIEANVTRPGTAREKGTGLGLLLCREIIEKNGGSLWFESEVGKGTTFYFKVPLVLKG